MVCFLIAFITVQQVCALAALTVRKHRLEIVGQREQLQKMKGWNK